MKTLWIPLVLYLVTAWFSEGFHHYDEHFQLLEFAGYKTGKTPVEALPWEFHDKIRPWFQPYVAATVVRGLALVGVASPFTAAFFLRVLSAILAWLALTQLLKCCGGWFQDERLKQRAIAIGCWLWFLPYLAVRFSSEGWSTSLFVLGFTTLILAVQGEKFPPWRYLLAGVSFGLAFECRFQAALLVLAAIAWYAKWGKPKLRDLALVGTGLALAFAAGRSLDFLGYGQWTLTPWTYLRVNLLEGKMSQWGTSPWWRYFTDYLGIGLPPISLLLLVGLLAAWVRKPRLSLTWVTLPFVAVHLLLSHKEPRFLFPIVILVPFAGLLALQTFPKILSWSFDTRAGRALWIFLVVLNALALVGRSLLPPRQEIGLYRAIYENASDVLYYTGDRDPFVMAGVPGYFYRPVVLKLVATPNPYVAPDLVALPSRVLGIAGTPCQIVYETIPGWLQTSSFWSLVQKTKPLEWTLLRCSMIGVTDDQPVIRVHYEPPRRI